VAYKPIFRCSHTLHRATFDRYDVTTPILATLRWLPVRQRVIFKTAVLVWKCLHDAASRYLADLCVPAASTDGRRQSRSAVSGALLQVPWTLTSTGQRSFAAYYTIRDAILTCARRLTGFSLIYRTVPTTKNCTTEKLKKIIRDMIWNRLPMAPRSPELSLSSFKRQLKTHLSVPALDSAGCSCGCRVPSSGAVVTTASSAPTTNVQTRLHSGSSPTGVPSTCSFW